MDLKQGRRTGKPRGQMEGKRAFHFLGSGLYFLLAQTQTFNITSKTALRVAYIETAFTFPRRSQTRLAES